MEKKIRLQRRARSIFTRVIIRSAVINMSRNLAAHDPELGRKLIEL